MAAPIRDGQDWPDDVFCRKSGLNHYDKYRHYDNCGVCEAINPYPPKQRYIYVDSSTSRSVLPPTPRQSESSSLLPSSQLGESSTSGARTGVASNLPHIGLGTRAHTSYTGTSYGSIAEQHRQQLVRHTTTQSANAGSNAVSRRGLDRSAGTAASRARARPECSAQRAEVSISRWEVKMLSLLDSIGDQEWAYQEDPDSPGRFIGPTEHDSWIDTCTQLEYDQADDLWRAKRRSLHPTRYGLDSDDHLDLLEFITERGPSGCKNLNLITHPNYVIHFLIGGIRKNQKPNQLGPQATKITNDQSFTFVMDSLKSGRHGCSKIQIALIHFIPGTPPPPPPPPPILNSVSSSPPTPRAHRATKRAQTSPIEPSRGSASTSKRLRANKAGGTQTSTGTPIKREWTARKVHANRPPAFIDITGADESNEPIDAVPTSEAGSTLSAKKTGKQKAGTMPARALSRPPPRTPSPPPYEPLSSPPDSPLPEVSLGRANDAPTTAPATTAPPEQIAEILNALSTMNRPQAEGGVATRARTKRRVTWKAQLHD